MQERLIELLINYEEWAIAISLLLNIAISILGFLPSVFLTAANLLVFGVWKGTMISFVGEALGAVVAFWLYRKGFKKYTDRKPKANSFIHKLLSAKGRDAFLFIFTLRLFPFIPSGLVTFTAAIGEVGVLLFVLASSLGKIPALVIEAYSVYQVSTGTTQGKIILTVVSIVGLITILGRLVKK
ncbi:TVP38/TMEM64 family protein [Fredinandcohnia sp. 179-A 10B2 NHS]|uniref:TVP38/TMEM64 family protein n=1 Tax=Fredinandcohnia sp. 179-A 10B2 NHS TaxID=3235176 RepID=UPI0039A00A3C